MRQITLTVAIFMSVMSLVACGGTKSAAPSVQQQSTPAPAPAPTPVPTPIPTPTIDSSQVQAAQASFVSLMGTFFQISESPKNWLDNAMAGHVSSYSMSLPCPGGGSANFAGSMSYGFYYSNGVLGTLVNQFGQSTLTFSGCMLPSGAEVDGSLIISNGSGGGGITLDQSGNAGPYSGHSSRQITGSLALSMSGASLSCPVAVTAAAGTTAQLNSVVPAQVAAGSGKVNVNLTGSVCGVNFQQTGAVQF